MNEKRKLTPALLFERFCYGCGDFGFAACFIILRFYHLDKEFDGIIKDLHDRASSESNHA